MEIVLQLASEKYDRKVKVYWTFFGLKCSLKNPSFKFFVCTGKSRQWLPTGLSEMKEKRKSSQIKNTTPMREKLVKKWVVLTDGMSAGYTKLVQWKIITCFNPV